MTSTSAPACVNLFEYQSIPLVGWVMAAVAGCAV
jgi:hypothetical protein